MDPVPRPLLSLRVLLCFLTSGVFPLLRALGNLFSDSSWSKGNLKVFCATNMYVRGTRVLRLAPNVVWPTHEHVGPNPKDGLADGIVVDRANRCEPLDALLVICTSCVRGAVRRIHPLAFGSLKQVSRAPSTHVSRATILPDGRYGQNVLEAYIKVWLARSLILMSLRRPPSITQARHICEGP